MQQSRSSFWMMTGPTMAVFSCLVVLSMTALALYSHLNPAGTNYFFQLVMAYSFVASLRFVIYISGAAAYSLKSKKIKPLVENFEPFVSVLLPAYNEASVVGTALKNFENINYKNFEVIVIDDGSTDQTFQTASKVINQVSFALKIFRKENGGKADALNYGISRAKGDFILCMDADSVLSKDTIKEGVKHFAGNSQLAAVGGMVHVQAVDGSLLERMQQLDYLVGHFQKKILSLFGKVSIVPGPIGLFRKQAILEVGGYETKDETFAEDAEVTLRLIASGWEIVCSDHMKSYTEVPQGYGPLIQQRYRWSRGVYKALVKNLNSLDVLETESNTLLSLYLIWELVLIPIVNVAILLSFMILFCLGKGLVTYSLPMLYVVSLDLVIAILAVRAEGKTFSWIFVALVSRFSYANILLVWNFFSLQEEWRSVTMSWDKLERKGLYAVSDEEGAA